jgi:hypothetical protein
VNFNAEVCERTEQKRKKEIPRFAPFVPHGKRGGNPLVLSLKLGATLACCRKRDC